MTHGIGMSPGWHTRRLSSKPNLIVPKNGSRGFLPESFGGRECLDIRKQMGSRRQRRAAGSVVGACKQGKR